MANTTKTLDEALKYLKDSHAAPCGDPACDSVYCFVANTLLAGREDRARLDWLEANSRIHAEDDKAQVVVRYHEADPRLGNEEAGFYVVRWGDLVVYEGGGADRGYRKTYHGDSLRAALDAARDEGTKRSGQGASSGGEHG